MAFSLLFFGTHPWAEGGGNGRGWRSAVPPSRKKEREAAREGERFAPSSWPGTTKEALSRGCSFGQCLLFLPRSLPSPSFSLAHAYPRPLPPSPRALSLASSRSPLSFIAPPHQRSTPVLHRAHETRVPAKSLCHLANERPSAARTKPRRARSRKISSSRRRRRRRRWWRRGGPAPRITGNIVRPGSERERGAFGNVHTYRGLKARTVDKEEAFSFGLFPPAAARNSVKVRRALRRSHDRASSMTFPMPSSSPSSLA